ncbi:Serine acetyltransferase [uncultured Desulfobacterium sp.]|uniref:Serine acetyltransferase n=1 Tax=uncultured Desulfobacterium sp. TaxID=201089 RepID=A0A445N003_9BACT|nr:Serine acetyltransferase [uncultured Desulfobacterium sp.]
MKCLREDLDRYFFLAGTEGRIKKLNLILFTQGIWATFVYRIGRKVFENRAGSFSKRLLFKPLGICLSVAQKVIEIVTGISIPFSADIGPGLYIGHFGGIILHSKVKIGAYCNLSQNVTIGEGGRGENSGVPVLGNFVWIGPGAKVFGKIDIGDGVAIGANAVISKSLPNSSVAVGIPCKVINYHGSKELVRVRPESFERWHRELNGTE